jgi:type IV secretion system protein TrbH
MIKWPFTFALLSLMSLISLLSGCVATPYYGNYVETDSTTYNQVIAGDVVGQMVQLYPPANTKFNLQHSSEDAFGAALIQNLRVSGYAVQENKPSKLYTNSPHQINIKSDANKRPVRNKVTVKPEAGTTLAYILDETSDVYRLSVMVDDQILTRAYRPYKESIYPAGSWVRKE